ncbi:Stk1 family PASTA domain-containing Ser/Thr kinase [Ornithinibacillus sp. 4-3]|uniref:Serine/threonine-protein kinase PrkC n=1 Tax=Ornithinibacillus sp. 4-3 TaxID=3231488 RepID=A0AB39HRP9_9BACI
MLEGRLLSERYLIEKTIGGGGMANVYLAKDTILHRDVAIKVLRLEYANDKEFITRFDREAQAATSLSHPNIVNIYDVGEEDHILYMVMEYVDGLTLKEYIQRYGPINVHEAIDIMKQVTSAIAHAHANNLVHRDIKPQNILIDTYGNVKVTDFGIATALSATALTQTNSILGSVHYLSPEQARGGMATKLSDIYSLGIVLFELLTGRIPFNGQSAVSIALKHLQEKTPSVKEIDPSIPQSVENIVLRATTKDPFHRYNSAYEMQEALEMALDPSLVNEAPYVPPVEAGDETKAIPIITKAQLQNSNSNDDTIIHHAEEQTKKIPETKEAPPKKKKKRKKWKIILAILIGLFIAGIAALFIVPGLLQPKDVVIPDVIGEPFDEAEEKLKELDLEVEQEFVSSDEIEEDHVVESSPRAERTVKAGSTVTLYVSEGQETFPFDDYVGRDFSQVERLLRQNGFENFEVNEKFSDEDVGEIIAQIEPEPGSEVVPSETVVVFDVSKGEEPVTLDNLVGMTEEEARDYIDENDLTINITATNSEEGEAGHVFRQQPEAGTELNRGDRVDIYISLGPEVRPPAHHTVTFTVPYTLETEEGEDPEEQTVIIYVDDMENDLSEVFDETQITSDQEFSITLTIEHGQSATYRVVRDDETFIEKTVPY